MLAPMLGTKWAPILFAVALIASGQSSTVTGTLAGQIVMEGYLNLRIAPWIRRLLTRVIAIIPALITIQVFGESSTGKLLVLSQVILSMQLGFAIIPLIHFVSEKEKMGKFAIGITVKTLAWISAAIIILLNVKLVYEQVADVFTNGNLNLFIKGFILIVIFSALALLAYTLVFPWVKHKKIPKQIFLPHGTFTGLSELGTSKYKRIAIALDFSKTDTKTLQHALSVGGKNAHYVIIHIVETPGAFIYGKDVEDYETVIDKKTLEQYTSNLHALGFNSEIKIGFDNRKTAIPKLVEEFNADLLVMGAHGHKTVKDLIFGTTVDSVRHAVKIPVMIV
jgi:manganese transport protein